MTTQVDYERQRRRRLFDTGDDSLFVLQSESISALSEATRGDGINLDGALQLPGTDLEGVASEAVLVMPVVPGQADDFVCRGCFLNPGGSLALLRRALNR